jgi:hypothetical protein
MAADMIRQRLKRKGVHLQYHAGAILKDRDDFKNARLVLGDASDFRYFEFPIHRSRRSLQRHSAASVIIAPNFDRVATQRAKSVRRSAPPPPIPAPTPAA